MNTLKLKSLTFFLILNSQFLIPSSAQVVYTDVNPDVTFSNSGAYSLDLNNDGTIDYSIVVYSGSSQCHKFSFGSIYSYVRITPLNQNAVAFIASANAYPSMIDSGMIINDNKFSFQSSANQILRNRHQPTIFSNTNGQCYPYYPITFSGNWNTAADKYLWLKILVNGQYYFGWAKLSVTTTAFTIREYAFNSIPNQPIRSGETSCTMPTVTLNASGPLSFCAGDSLTLTANGTGYLYQWKKDGVNIAGAKSQTQIVKTAGVYKCKVTNSCGSKTSGGKTVTVPCKITNENFAETLEHLSVFPNPATNSVTIKFPSDEEGTIQIINLFGQIVFSEKVNAEQEQIDVSRFHAGMYVVRWSSGGNSETKTFSVVK